MFFLFLSLFFCGNVSLHGMERDEQTNSLVTPLLKQQSKHQQKDPFISITMLLDRILLKQANCTEKKKREITALISPKNVGQLWYLLHNYLTQQEKAANPFIAPYQKAQLEYEITLISSLYNGTPSVFSSIIKIQKEILAHPDFAYELSQIKKFYMSNLPFVVPSLLVLNFLRTCVPSDVLHNGLSLALGLDETIVSDANASQRVTKTIPAPRDLLKIGSKDPVTAILSPIVANRFAAVFNALHYTDKGLIQIFDAEGNCIKTLDFGTYIMALDISEDGTTVAFTDREAQWGIKALADDTPTFSTFLSPLNTRLCKIKFFKAPTFDLITLSIRGQLEFWKVDGSLINSFNVFPLPASCPPHFAIDPELRQIIIYSQGSTGGGGISSVARWDYTTQQLIDAQSVCAFEFCGTFLNNNTMVLGHHNNSSYLLDVAEPAIKKAIYSVPISTYKKMAMKKLLTDPRSARTQLSLSNWADIDLVSTPACFAKMDIDAKICAPLLVSKERYDKTSYANALNSQIFIPKCSVM
jgi:hypothetical protein